jgi:hypothetical protein
MYKYLCTHTFPVGAFSREKICEVAEVAQHDPDVRGYRSFFNLSEGKGWCVLEAKDRDSVIAWFKKMDIPYDNVVLVELEGERGLIHDLREEPVLAGANI